MKSVGIGHQDQITAVSYDFYGRRMATCSADHTIKVFDKVDGAWQLNDSWRAHEAPVIRVSWVGPKHTPILASASHDCTVKLWEEIPDEAYLSGKRWRRRYTISDFKGPLYDVQFSQSTTSLKLAAIASDGVLRVYEAIDTSNLGFWTATFEEPLLNRPVSRQLQSSFSLSWSPTPSYSDWIAVSVLDDAMVFKFDAQSGKYLKMGELPGHHGLIRDIEWAPVFGRSFGMVATACKDGMVRVFTLKRSTDEKNSSDNADAGGDSEHNEKARTQSSASNTSNMFEKRPIQGFETTPEVPKMDFETGYDIALIHESDLHNGEVWRVTWNSSGTILASTGDDGQVRFWKSVFMGSFQCMALLKKSDMF